MTNGRDVQEFEENNYEELVASFVKDNSILWENHVWDYFCEDQGRAEELMLETARDKDRGIE